MPPTTLSGLTASEAAQQLKRFGYNELSKSSRRSLLAILSAEAREPMVILLFVCGAVYFTIGDVKEALVLLGSVFLVIGITLFQERKTERVLESLRNLSSPRASVMRDGKLTRIPSNEVVPGDVLVLDAGDRIPADVMLIDASELKIDESLLTGESVPVLKKADERAFASTLIVSGRGHARVEFTGSSTEVGKIGRALNEVTSGESPLKREIQSLVKLLAGIAFVLCLVLAIGWGVMRGAWQEGILAGLTLAMSLLPEEFPVVLTIFFALGAYRIARERVMTRRLPAIETLGSATVLCADKTGTLTENQMRVTHFATVEHGVKSVEGPLDASGRELAMISALACPSNSFDPVDQAAQNFGAQAAPDELSSLRQQAPVHEFPLSSERPMIAEVRQWQGQLLIALKGAPEAVAAQCGWDAARIQQLPTHIAPLSAEGLRIIAVAKAVLAEGHIPARLEDIRFEFLGWLGMMDPLRAGVKQAVEECHTAGIQVVMITGDYPQTAAVIARQAGLRETGCITGSEMEQEGGARLPDKILQTDIFARFSPLHKLRLVQLLRESGAVVAMTGDGVNDAPALKAAHIGIAMGARGTDVAREAADLVVLDDNFVSIVGAIRLGRGIYINLQKSLSYLVSVHVPIAGMALLPLIMGWPLFFTPIHIVFLELVIDPACSLVFEGESADADVMKRPPRPSAARLLDRPNVLRSLLEGLIVFAVTATVFAMGLKQDGGEWDARALGFSALVIGNLLLILSNRSRSQSFWKTIVTPNKAWLLVTLGALTALGLSLYVPALQKIFKFSFLNRQDVVLLGGALGVLLMMLWMAHLVTSLRARGLVHSK